VANDMFRPVSSKASFPQMEESILKLWQEKNVFQQSIDRRKGSPRFTLNEGPPTANGNPGIHHVLSRIFKDVIPRYKAMKGYYTPRIGGWDTHGLPVELEVEKTLGFSGKAQIEQYGVAKFNAKCRESVFRYLKEWEALTGRIGFWIDLDHAYVTMKNEYIETVWWAIKQMWDKGLVYQGYRVTPHCPRCGTSLSSHEVALGYKDDVEDTSVYVKFKTAGKSIGSLSLNKPTYLLAWTTTPWTLPGNTALAVAAAADYTIVEVDNEYLSLAEARLGAAGLGDKRVVGKVKGNDLVGLRYEPLYKPQAYGIPVKSFQRVGQETPILKETAPPSSYPVIATDFVSMEDGTGIVHIAPAYGEVDYQAGEDNNLDFVHMVDLQGKIIGNYPFAGKFVKNADKDIIADLNSRGLLYRTETIRHTYPFCWRCDAPLLYYAKQTWYIKTTAVKEQLIAGNAGINWYPEHIKYGRFGDWLEHNVDWAFSRERYWGTPLPIWRCESCGQPDCIGGLDDLKKKPGITGLNEPLDLHRPFVDELSYDCPKCGGKMRRAPEVIDCWFDSGSMPIAQYHFPFEGEKSLDDLIHQEKFPADYICEAVDQTRGWFYSLHAISTLLFNQPSFKNVICLGHILDNEGEKMSKARGNVVEPWAIINKYGADPLRWYFFTSSPPGNVRRFDEKMLTEVTRRFFLTLWNVYSFFVTYANIDRFTPVSTPASGAPPELDRWLISELNQLITDVDSSLEHYDPTEAGRKIESFVDELSNWYVRRSRRRFWKSENDADKLSAYNTLYHCLVTLSKLLAPLTPFLAEELYQNLVCAASPQAPESVHLADFPVADASKIDERLSDNIRKAMEYSSKGRAVRSKAGIKVRQPIDVSYASLGMEQALQSEAIRQSVQDELNVKSIKLVTSAELAAMAKNPDYVVDDEAAPSTAIYKLLSKDPEKAERLRKEGTAREIVHRLQTMRRADGFDIADHIITYYQGDDYIRQVLQEFADDIKLETLSRQLVEGIPEQGVTAERYKLDGHEVRLGVKKLD